jgi:hypothetical protein
MIAFRDILIFAGLAALAAAVIASLFPAGEGASPVPACSDCAFKLTGGYWIRQYGNYAALYLGTREAARYGWAYVDGRPLSIGESVTCDPMYVHVLSGLAYVSCSDVTHTFRRWVQPLDRRSNVSISTNPLEPGCTYTVDVWTNTSIVKLKVYSETLRKFVYSASDIPPASFTFNLPWHGMYIMRIRAPPLLDEFYILRVKPEIKATDKVKIYWRYPVGYNPDIPADPRTTSLLAISLNYYWFFWDRVKVDVSGSYCPGRNIFEISVPEAGPLIDFLLAWQEHSTFDPFAECSFTYANEVWRLTFTPSGPVLTRLHSSGNFWHEVYADGQLIWTWNKQGPKNDVYVGFDPTITVRFVSQVSSMNAEITFTKVCMWERLQPQDWRPWWWVWLLDWD